MPSPMLFPETDRFWDEVRRFIERECSPLDPVLAPAGFLDVHAGTYGYHVSKTLPVDTFRLFVFHKGMLDRIPPGFFLAAVEASKPVLANEVFVVFRHRRFPAPSGPVQPVAPEHLNSFHAMVARIAQAPPEPARHRTAVLVTTYNRSSMLERSLPQIAALGKPMLVVDDASDEPHRRAHAETARRHGAEILTLPANRGSACALNTGLSYWLADPDVEWISLFEDDVDVRPDALEVLAKVQDAKLRPCLTGRYNHRLIVAKQVVAGVEIYLQRSSAAVHVHAHRDYWSGVLPVPSMYLGAPKPGRGGPGADWWITGWAPRSATKQGGNLVCVPGLVRHITPNASSSTWAADPGTGDDPPL